MEPGFILSKVPYVPSAENSNTRERCKVKSECLPPCPLPTAPSSPQVLLINSFSWWFPGTELMHNPHNICFDIYRLYLYHLSSVISVFIWNCLQWRVSLLRVSQLSPWVSGEATAHTAQVGQGFLQSWGVLEVDEPPGCEKKTLTF